MKLSPLLLRARRIFTGVAIVGAAGALLIASVAWGGIYSQGFAFADGTANLGDNPASTIASTPAGTASVQANALRLTSDTTANTTAAYKLPVLDTGKEVTEFTVAFQLMMTKADPAVAPGEGFSLSFGAIPTSNGTGESGFVMANGLTVSWDTSDPTGDGPFLRVLANGVNVRTILASNLSPAGTSFNGIPNFFFDGLFHAVVIHWDLYDGLDLSYAGQPLMNDIPTPGFSPAVNNRFAFSARTSATLNQGTVIDDLSVTTVPSAPIETGGPVITELVADNEESKLDEAGESGAWLEIYNGQNAALNLLGWTLTDDPATPNKWTLPSIQMAAYGYVLIWADGKNQTTGTNYHANFSLAKAGGHLELSKPDGTSTSKWNYPPQVADISYGTQRPTQVKGYLETPTPGLKNIGLQADGPPSIEDVNFSRTGGLLAGPTTLTVSAPGAPGAVIRYTLGNTRPNITSPAWPAAGFVLNSPGTAGALNTDVNIRAAVFEPGRLPGKISSRTFVPLDASLTNYRGTGQPFTSNLPIIVFDSFGNMIDSASQGPGLRPFQYSYGLSIMPDPATGGKAVITGPVDHQGRGGVHKRGETSAGFLQTPYAWELWDNYERDKGESVLGLTADSDWVLISNYNDKSVLRNKLPFDTMFDQNGEGSAMREKYVEVFFRQRTTPGSLSYADYRGIYVFTEKIKRQKNRVNIEKLDPWEGTFANNPAVDDAGVISGGYIIRKDKTSPETAFTTTGGQGMQIVEPNLPSTAQVNYIKGYMSRFETALNGAAFADPVNGYAKFIDVPSFIDNHLWVEIFKQIDGYRLSTYYVKDRGGKVRSRPLWDYNLSLGNANYNGGSDPTGWYYVSGGLAENNEQYPYYKRLFTDPEFTRKYWDRYWALRRTLFSTSTIMARIDSLAAELSNHQPLVQIGNGTGTFSTTNPTGVSVPSLDNPIGRNHARWQHLGIYDWPNADGFGLRTRWNPAAPFDPTTISNTTNVATSTSEIAHVKAWLTRRLMWMDDQSMSFHTTVRNLKPPTLNQYGGQVPSGFQIIAGNPNPSGITYYTLDGTDPRPAGGTAPVSGALSLGGVTSTPSTFVLVEEAGTGDYLVPSTTNGGDALTAAQWTSVADPPNSANWQKGKPFGIGYKTPIPSTFDPYIQTDIGAELQPPGGTANATVYVRKSFNVSQTQIDELTAVRLKARYDDSFIVYLNGTELKRENITNPAAFVPQWNSGSSTTRNDTTAATLATITALPSVQVIRNLLVPGTNTLAFHGLNSSAGNDDFLLRPQFEIDTVHVVTDPPPNPLSPLTANTNLKLRIYNSATALWSPLTEASFLINVVPANAANLVISEFSYHPSDPTPTEIGAGFNGSNDFEFLELMNISAGTIDLTNCRFTGGIAFDWAEAPPAARTLDPGARMVICENTAAFASRYGAFGATVAGTFAGNLDNGGETLRLLAADGTDIKFFAYDDDPPWPKDPDGAGYSLVLNNATTNPNHGLASSWRSSASKGGKPGQADATPFTGLPNGDTDGDGLPDLLEHALGTSLTSPTPPYSPTLGWANFNVDGSVGTYLQFSFVRNTNADGFTLLPQVSSSLGNWQDGSTALTFVESVTTANGIVTETWRSTQPVASLPPQLFARLRVQSVP